MNKNKNYPDPQTTYKLKVVKSFNSYKVIDVCKLLDLSTATYYTRLSDHKWHVSEIDVIEKMYKKHFDN